MHYNIELLSLNVNGLGDNFKRQSMFFWIKKFKYDLVFLQETHTVKDIENRWKTEWGGDIYFSHGKSNKSGVAILINKNLDYKIVEEISDENGRFIVLNMQVEGINFILVNFYAPTKNFEVDQIEYVDKLRSILENKLDCNIVLGGDFNTVLDPCIDKKGGAQFNTPLKYTQKLESFMEEFELCDIWRVKNPNLKYFTWRKRNPLIQCRLDFWLISEFLTGNVTNTAIEPSVKTDHSRITLSISGTQFNKRGPGFWKFNSDLLTDKDYVDIIKKVIVECDKKYETLENKNLKWDAIKCEIRGETVKYSKRKNKLAREKELKLKHNLQDLETQLSKAGFDNEINSLLEEIENVKDELQQIIDKQTRGALIRSHAEHCEGNEKNSKYFLSLEKRNYKNKCINKLNVNGVDIFSESKILLEEKNFYENLYKSRNNGSDLTESFDFFKDEFIPKLSDAEKNICDANITEFECTKVLKTFKNNKSPGSDGLTAEFYKFFWIDIRKFIMESFEYSFETGSLSVDQRSGILTLIPKKDKDRTFLANWRPLSILNFDYKLLAKIIAHRMKTYLPKLIDPDQTGYVNNRYIGENLRLIADIILYTNLKNHPGLLLLVDFEKAFDTIEWNYIQKALTSFNFGEKFKRWISILYTDISSFVVNNGYKSDPFKIHRGVRQGCPLSPFLFILASELLAIAIRENEKINGIKIGEVEIKISQLADDTTCFFEDELSAKFALNIFKKFEKCSGLKVNLTKTEAVWIGRNKYDNDGSLPIKWTRQFKTLGLSFNALNENTVENLDVCIEKMEGVLKMWKPRSLSLIGKVVILKSLAISKLIYVVSSSHVPSNYVRNIQQKINQFIWNDGTPKIKNSVLQKPLKDGGLKAPNFEIQLLSMRIMWIKRFLFQNNARWKCLPNAFFPLFDLRDIFMSRCEIDFLFLKIPDFYNEVLLAWKHFKAAFIPSNTFEVRKEFLWFNPFIQINGISIFYKVWYDHGIKYINDIVKQNGEFMSCNDINTKYNLNISFLDILSIKSAIPTNWKEMLTKQNVNPNSESFKVLVVYKGKNTPISSLTAKDVYNILLEQIEVSVTAKEKWEESFNVEISGNKWEQIFCLPFKCTTESKLQAFQYKILHRFAAHNYLLKKYNLSDTERCFYCQNVETLEHKYYECREVFAFWRHFFSWWSIVFGERLNLSKDSIIFGMLESDDIKLNFCILLGKYYINYVKNIRTERQCTVSLQFFLKFVKRRLELLEYIYLIKDNLNSFHDDWGMFMDNL